jgi:AcrR family transcriptional regulator
MTQRDRQKEETRQRLLEAAARLIAENGFAGTRTADVAAAVGVSHGAVFVHFPTREALVLAVTAALGRRITDRLHALGAEGGGLRGALTAHLRCLAEEEALYARLLTERPLLPADFARTWTAIQSAVSHHILETAPPARVPPHFVFNTWIGLVHHYLMNRELFAPTGGVLKRHGRMLVDNYLDLLQGRHK